MASDRVGLLHPGEMGAAVGAILVRRGRQVVWASSGRSELTRRRADAAGLDDVGTVSEAAKSGILFSICPPHAALEVARSVAGFGGLYVDANAISPATARAVAAVIEAGGGRFVDGGIVGAPPYEGGATRLYLSGPEAATAAELFADSAVDARPVSAEVGAASAVKMTYAAWTKGTAALLLAIRELARSQGVEEALLDEWSLSLPELAEQSERASRSAHAKGWRWVGEMEEIAATFAAADLPAGFHEAAAAVFRTMPAGPARA
jgi:3-hydroxyisobutyrate dehydrogenase-like beta-hydroxyacid dehydrogenase